MLELEPAWVIRNDAASVDDHPRTRVRRHCRHQSMSYRIGSISVMLVWPHLNAHRYHGIAAPVVLSSPIPSL